MAQIEQTLTTVPHLKHLELYTRCSLNVVDGHRWENISSSLTTLNFFFIINIEQVEDVLDTFRTTYWLEVKRWFVAFYHDRFFSIPRFADTYNTVDVYPIIHSTATNDNIVSNNVTELNLSKSLDYKTPYFPNVRTLELNESVRLETLLEIIPMKKITYLILSGPIVKSSSIVRYLSQLSNLHTLSIKNDLSSFLNCAQEIRFEHIRTLVIDTHWEVNDEHYIRQLCHIFPFTELLYTTSAHSSILVYLIDGFKHLSNVSFRCSMLSETERYHWSVKPEWAIYEARRLTIGKFICQFSFPYVHAWIDEQVC